MSETCHDDQSRSDGPECLFCSFVKSVRSATEKHNAFYTHMYNARIEVLQAFRSLIDQRISSLEKKKSSGEGKKATKIVLE
jgi:hypothetical protein